MNFEIMYKVFENMNDAFEIVHLIYYLKLFSNYMKYFEIMRVVFENIDKALCICHVK